MTESEILKRPPPIQYEQKEVVRAYNLAVRAVQNKKRQNEKTRLKEIKNYPDV